MGSCVFCPPKMKISKNVRKKLMNLFTSPNKRKSGSIAKKSFYCSKNRIKTRLEKCKFCVSLFYAVSVSFNRFIFKICQNNLMTSQSEKFKNSLDYFCYQVLQNKIQLKRDPRTLKSNDRLRPQSKKVAKQRARTRVFSCYCLKRSRRHKNNKIK